jgi:tRNA-2-methylthio-N6-dimethylallyladenosine synthase
MAEYENICKHIHLPVQSGSSIMLEKMRRKYNREWYLERVDKIRSVIPDCGITTDVIAGFCGETEQDHQDTLTLMEKVVFDSAFMFAYSERPGTLASRKYPDDIPYEVKTSRLNEIIALQGRMSLKSNEKEIGKTLKVLVEEQDEEGAYIGRTEYDAPEIDNSVIFTSERQLTPGEFVRVQINDAFDYDLVGVEV